MKKKGYTLAEALIALGLIGVIAALMLPLMNKFKPDGDKALFIRTYDSIIEVNSMLLEDEVLYPHEVYIENDPEDCNLDEGECYHYDYSRAPFLNAEPVEMLDGTLVGDKISLSAAKKYCDALLRQMHANVNDNLQCATAYGSNGNNYHDFTLVNGVSIRVSEVKDKNCFKLEIVPAQTRKYSLLVYPNGKVIPNFKAGEEELNMTISHLMTRTSWRKGQNLKQKTINDEKIKYEEMGNFLEKQCKKEKLDPYGDVVVDEPED